MKYAFIDNNKAIFNIERMCSMLKLHRSGYYAWLNKLPGPQKVANESLDKKIIMKYDKNC